MSNLSPKRLLQQAIQNSPDVQSQNARDLLCRLLEYSGGLEKSVLFVSGSSERGSTVEKVSHGAHDMNSVGGRTRLDKFTKAHGIGFRIEGFHYGQLEELGGRYAGLGALVTPRKRVDWPDPADILVVGPDLKPLDLTPLSAAELLTTAIQTEHGVPDDVRETLITAVHHTNNLTNPIWMPLTGEGSNAFAESVRKFLDSMESAYDARRRRTLLRAQGVDPIFILLRDSQETQGLGILPDRRRPTDHQKLALLTRNPDGSIDADILDSTAEIPVLPQMLL